MLILKIESPMTNNWEDIWNNRKITVEQELSILETLIKNDGFDTPFGFMKEKDWRDYVDSISHTLNINNKDTIFEVGCCAGAFLFPFYERNIFVSGIDISSSLISVAKKYLHTNAKFLTNKEAINVDSTEKFDFLFANHVFHYFPNLEYANKVLETMLAKSNKAVIITGIPDFEKKSESENFRKGALSEKEYNEKYDGLSILYFYKKWFQDIALLHNYNCYFNDHNMPGFVQNKFRFDCTLKRNF